MDVYRNTFDTSLSLFTASLNDPRTLFCAIDTELSGIRPRFPPAPPPPSSSTPTPSAKHTLDDRYRELKALAAKYAVIQVGFCVVSRAKDPDPSRASSSYVARTFNLNISPVIDPYLRLERDVVFQASALEFLVASGFNLTSVFAAGIPYLSRQEEASIKQDQARRTTSGDSHDLIDVDDAGSLFLDAALADIRAFLDDPNPEFPFLNVATQNAYQRWLIYQTVRETFADRLVAVGKNGFIQLWPADQKNKDLDAKRRADEFDRILARGVGARTFFDRLAASGVPVVGHNVFADLGYIYHQFFSPLADGLSAFCRAVTNEFSPIFDSKYIAKSIATASSGAVDKSDLLSLRNTDLGSLVRWASQKEGGPRIEFEKEFNKYPEQVRPGSFTYEHEAGYDALATARVFIALAAIGRRSDQGPDEEVVREALQREDWRGKLSMGGTKEDFLDLSSAS